MPAFVEFVLVAIALFLWESTLWLPLRSVALRRRSGGKWKALSPDSWFVARELGLVPMLPLPPDAGLAPCETPPMMADGRGGVLIETNPGIFCRIESLAWEDIAHEPHHLRVAGRRVRISSPRCIDLLRRAKARGDTPETAVQLAWRLALSPGRASREWRRWKLVSSSLRWFGPALTIGFFAGLPLAYVYLGSLSAACLALWLWCVMAWTAAHLWWLGKRVYPDARSALRMDALLSLVVPFHAMRALEIASVHAMALTHPASLMLSTGDVANPWLGRFIRRVLHPLPGNSEELGFRTALQPLLEKALSHRGMSLADFDTPPDALSDPEASLYCPRCHGLYQKHARICGDCPGMELRPLSQGLPT